MHTRPPLGVFNLVDLAMMVGGIILMPDLSLLLPNWLTVSLLIVGVLSILGGVHAAGAVHSRRITELIVRSCISYGRANLSMCAGLS